ncbi:putative UDP-glucuronosyl/UDP-glucosyltransferase, UDP-glycosyltransferase family [Helianthus annuus]|nr:putative UDP-glucuronosyl/UDP-glucosyltransferase, UDP-glycosyltransferase family [Helianthus annuus]
MNQAQVAIIATPNMGNLVPAVEFATHLTNHHLHHISVTILTISMPQSPLIDNYVQSHSSTDHIRFIQLPPADIPPPNQYNTRIGFTSLYIQNHKPIVQQTLQNLSPPLVGFFVDMFCTSMIDVANDLNIPCYLYFASPAAYLGFVLHLTTLSDTESTDSANGLSVPSFLNPVPSTAFPLFCINKNELGYSWFVHHTLSMGSINRDQVREIATGLERAGYRFLWSLREPAKTKLELPNDYEKLEEGLFPDGFIDRTTQIGLVCGWVSQVSVLAHKAIGGFVSHCGWNSILESISYGVPIATWPLYAEQHLNAFEMVRELGLSVEIRMGKGSDLVLADEVERGVRELMDGGDGELKKKVKEMSDKAKKALTKNGSSFQALEDLMNILLSQV